MLTPLQTLLLDCLKSSSDPISAERLKPLTAAEWTSFLKLTEDQRIRSLLYFRLKQKELLPIFPDEVIQELREANKQITTHNLIYLCELHKITKAFQAKGVSVIVLKGMYLINEVYEQITLREMNDIDLLVEKENLERAVHILENQGYHARVLFSIDEKVATKKDLPRFIKPGVGSVELHWTLADPGDLLSIDSRGLWDRAIPTNIPSHQVLGLSPEDLLVYLCVHTSYQHQFAFGLRPSCDISQVIAHYGERFDWERFVERAKQWNAQRGVYLALRAARNLVDAEVPDEPLEQLKPEKFDETLLKIAIAQIFTEKSFANSLHRVGSKIVVETSWWSRIRLFLGYIFMSKTSLADRYSLSPNSLKIYWFYLVHFKDTLKKYRNKAWLLIKNDKRLAQLANRRLTLMDWLSEED